MADAQASGACGRKIVWVQVPSPAFLIYQPLSRDCLIIIPHVPVKVNRFFQFFLKIREFFSNPCKSLFFCLFYRDFIPGCCPGSDINPHFPGFSQIPLPHFGHSSAGYNPESAEYYRQSDKPFYFQSYLYMDL